MSGLSTAMVAGAVAGVGLWLAWTGWVPTRPPLAELLARLGQSRPAQISGSGLDARVGSWARRVSVVDRVVDAMRTDLRVVGRSSDDQAAAIVVAVLCGVLWAPVVAAGGWLVGFRVPIAVALWFALLGGVVGGVWSIRSVRARAFVRRRDLSEALAACCDVAGICLAAGRGVESALETAAAAGRGWPFEELRAALQSGYVRGDTPWAAQERLGVELGHTDLVELAAAISLAGGEGAAVRDTIRAKGRSIRERLAADAERAAAAVTERMSVPATFLLFGFVIFLGYPALHVLLA